MTEPTYIWKNQELRTIGDLVDAIAGLENIDQAQAFITGYRLACPHADSNAGYVTGYLDPVRGVELRQWMGTAHPIFGMGSPTPEEAVAAGVALATGENGERDAG